MTRLIFLLVFWVCGMLPVAAQELAGSWAGKLNVQGQSLQVVMRMTCDGDSIYRVTLDVPQQGLSGVPAQTVRLAASGLTVGFPQFNASYQGVMMGENTFTGVFTQNGYNMPLTLNRMQRLRPQTPQAPYPYESREVAINHSEAGIVLNGTLTIPRGEGPFPAVVLVTGSGMQNRDEEILGHKPFLVLADYLTRAGIAVLRYDDRGFGEPDEVKRQLAHSTTADFAGDALAAFALLRSQPEIDPVWVGILGHSEGASVALIAAGRCPEVAFVASLAGAMVKGRRVHAEQLCEAARTQGIPLPMVEDFGRQLEAMYDIMEQTPPEKIDSEGIEQLNEVLAAEGTSLPEPFHQNLRMLLALGKDPWFRFFLTYDPARDIHALGLRPMLAVNGDRDVQVDAAINLEAIATLRPAAAYPSDLIRCYEGRNHLFQPCAKGTVDEYEQIEITIDPQVLDDVTTWIKGLPR